MAEKTINVRLKNRYDTEANWSSANPILLEGEIAISSDKNGKHKVGNGTSKWSELPYVKSELSKEDVTGALGYTPPTTNTTYTTGTASKAGITKLYQETGVHTDGTMTQVAITEALGDKANASHNHEASDINLPTGTNGVLYNNNGDIAVSAVTYTELSYLDGVNANVQNQLNGKASSSHTHNYAGASTAGGSANSAVKLDTASAGSATQPVYFSGGKPVAGTYTLEKSVPSNAVFTDTKYSAFKGATTEAAGGTGLVPAPATGAANRYLRSDGTWQVPPDTNTTYTLGSFGITATAAELNYMDGVTSNVQTQLNGKAASGHTHNYAGSGSSGGSANSAVKLDSSAGSATQPVYFSGGKPVACTYTLGKSVPSNAVFTDTNTWIALKGATASTAGTAGYAPAPAAGKQNSFLRGDGTWAVPPNTTYNVATTSANGLMSSGDKTKLDGIATGANKYTHPTGNGNNHIPSGGSSGQILRWSAAGTAVWGSDNNTTYGVFKAATSSAAGGTGLVPAPAAGKQGQYLRGDGQWATPTNTTYSVMGGATSSAAGRQGLVPAPAAGYNTRYLRGDGQWGTTATTSAAGLMSATQVSQLNDVVSKVSKLNTNFVDLFYLKYLQITIQRPNSDSDWSVTDVRDPNNTLYNSDGKLPVINGYIPILICESSTSYYVSQGAPKIWLQYATIHNYMAITAISKKFSVTGLIIEEDNPPGAYSYDSNNILVLYVKYDFVYDPFMHPPYGYGDIEWDK